MAIEALNKLKELDFSKQLAFAYLTCERLFPNYVYFSKKYKFGNPAFLKDAIEYLYNAIFEKQYEKDKIDSLIKNVVKNIPEPSDYETGLASSALDACTAIEESLYFILDKNFPRIESISTFATDTVHMHIQEIDKLDFNTDINFQQKIDNHPLMKKEIKIQSGIVFFLNNIKTTALDFGDLQTLIHLQKNNNKGNLNL
jgi:uncharacterized protein YjaG (DUF416 family)